MRSRLSGRFVIDTSALIELVFSTPEGLRLKQAIRDEDVEAHITEVSEAELRYVLCSQLGREEGERTARILMASGYLQVEDTAEILVDAARYKCERAISLADCLSLSLAKRLACTVLFAHEEEELRREVARKPFDVRVDFLNVETIRG